MKRVLLQPAYVLHRRLYRESSYLIELFTRDYGRLTVVAKGVRKARNSIQGLLQPFTPLIVSWSGKEDLSVLTAVEGDGAPKCLRNDCLFAAFYLNELLMALLQKWDAHSALFNAYEKTLTALQQTALEQKILRAFEKYLLEELGYGVLPKSDFAMHQAFSPELFYRFVPEQGFVVNERGKISETDSLLFSGKNLLAIAKEDWQDEGILQDAKRLMRLLLTPLLGARPIHSRRLFMQFCEEKVANEE